MPLPPSHTNKSDFVADVEVGITYSDTVRVSAAQWGCSLEFAVSELRCYVSPVVASVFRRQERVTPTAAMASSCQSVAPATCVRAQTALQVGGSFSQSKPPGMTVYLTQ